MAATSVSQETEKKIMRFQIESTTNLGNQIKMKTNQQIVDTIKHKKQINKQQHPLRVVLSVSSTSHKICGGH